MEPVDLDHLAYVDDALSTLTDGLDAVRASRIVYPHLGWTVSDTLLHLSLLAEATVDAIQNPSIRPLVSPPCVVGRFYEAFGAKVIDSRNRFPADVRAQWRRRAGMLQLVLRTYDRSAVLQWLAAEPISAATIGTVLHGITWTHLCAIAAVVGDDPPDDQDLARVAVLCWVLVTRPRLLRPDQRGRAVSLLLRSREGGLQRIGPRDAPTVVHGSRAAFVRAVLSPGGTDISSLTVSGSDSGELQDLLVGRNTIAPCPW